MMTSRQPSLGIIVVGASLAGLRASEATGLQLREACDRFERQYVLRVLDKVQWNVSRAARMLGVHRNTILAKTSAISSRSCSASDRVPATNRHQSSAYRVSLTFANP